MMNALLVQINALGDAWTGWMWRACWQTAVVVAVAWCLTSLLRRSSPTIRCWIWRIAYLKVAALMVWTTPVNLPLLPAGHGTMLNDTKRGVYDQASAAGDPKSGAPAGKIAALVPEAVLREGAEGVAVASWKSEIASLPRDDMSRLTWRSILLLAWAFGAVFIGLRVVLEARAAWRLLRGACHLDRSELETVLCDVCERLGLRHPPRLLASESAAAPILVQFIRPAIVLPRRLLETLSLGDIRLAIAHEVAHVRRHDVAWNAVATAVHCVLYFHPLLWLAHRRARFEQESACDELVLTHVDAGAQQYGQMLLNVVERVRIGLQPSVVAVGMTGTYKTLCRRIEAMKHIRTLTRGQWMLAGSAIATVAILSIVPWRLVAQEKKANEVRAAAVDTPANQSDSSKENRSPEQMLIGVWRGGPSGNDDFVVASDGTYHWRNYVVPDGGPPGMGRPGKMGGASHIQQGKWKVEKDRLLLVFDLVPATSPLRGLPAISSPHESGPFSRGPGMYSQIAPPAAAEAAPAPLSEVDRTQKFEILRLDGSLLRMKPVWTDEKGQEHTIESGTLFYRRVEERALDELSPSAPPALGNVVRLVPLWPSEARELVDWFGQSEIEKLPWTSVERTAKAQNGELDFAELFQLSKVEAAAFVHLFKLTGGRFSKTNELAELGQLAVDELAAVNKIRTLFDNLQAVREAVDRELRGLTGPPAFGPRGRDRPYQTEGTEIAPQDREKRQAFERLGQFLDQLQQWLSMSLN